MKTELLIQMDGVKSSASASIGSSNGSDGQVFVMAASNLPWDLDVAVLRRLEKRVLVPLPSVDAREAMFRKHLGDRSAPQMDFAAVAQQTEGYSGADIELLSRECAMMPVRRLMHRIEEIDMSTGNVKGMGRSMIPDPPPSGKSGTTRRVLFLAAAESCLICFHYLIPLTGGAAAAKSNRKNTSGIAANLAAASAAASTQDIEALLREDPVTPEDIALALTTTKPSSDGKITK
jgi:SpoVK/Ycf46/Vps4 family AAA+-type ATPase